MSTVRLALRELNRHERPPGLVLVALLVASAYLVWLAWAMAYASFDVWGALIIAPVLLAISVPLVLRLTRDDDPLIARLILLALVLKLLSSLIRFYYVYEIYGGGDALEYHDWGSVLAPMFRSGDFTVDIERGAIGTGFMRLLTGYVYTFTGATQLGGFLVYSCLGFWGLYLFYRAFRIGYPDGDYRRYAALVFFLPSLLFWPSSIGKEAWMTLTLGLTAYGAARVFAHRRGAFALLGLGLTGTLMVRPHVALIAVVGVMAAYIVRRPKRASLLSPAAKVVGIAVLAAGAVVVISQVETFFGVSQLDQDSANQVFTTTDEQSSQGGSEFEAERSDSPLGLAKAGLAVVFRPWPTEASSGPALFASLEGVLLLALLVLSARRIAALPGVMLRTPYVAMAVTYTLLFIYAFSSVANFGIIARQRVQLFPFLLVLLCVLPRRAPPEADSEQPDEEQVPIR